MLKERDRKIAESKNVLNKVKDLEKALMSIDNVVDVEFDLSPLLDNLGEIIFLTKYDITLTADDTDIKKRKALKDSVMETASKFGLTKTGDRIEDYGEHFYWVFKHDKSWVL